MIFLWPGLLVFLVLIPLLVIFYGLILRRRRRTALRYSSLAMVRAALPGQSRLRRHLPPALFLLALAGLVTALARPALLFTRPTSRATVLLAIDVSGSMSATDILPSRLAAAEEAALSFIQNQKSVTQIGIVAFSSDANLVQAPTTNQSQLEAAIHSLTLGNSTAIGSGMLEALKAIARMHGQVLPPAPSYLPGAVKTPPANKAYAPEIIVLLTDGSNNNGPLPVDVAHLAARQGVRVYTIGYGPVVTAAASGTSPTPIDPQGMIPNTGGGDASQGGFQSFTLNYDAGTLDNIARITGGATYAASSAGELEKVFNRLPIQKTVKTETEEISAGFIAAGALLLVISLALSVLWHPLP